MTTATAVAESCGGRTGYGTRAALSCSAGGAGGSGGQRWQQAAAAAAHKLQVQALVKEWCLAPQFHQAEG
eukprot:15444972-Alexandrium_andersonii.AAC.1